MLPTTANILEEGFIYTHFFNKEMLQLMHYSDSPFPDNFVKILNHTINAHQIWIDRIEGRQDTVGVWDIRPVADLLEQNEHNFINSLKCIEGRYLDSLIEYKSTSGQLYVNAMHDILFHVINHSSYHRGQLNTFLRASGRQPLITDFIIYKRVAI
jgi:uncharacterized damage-inducible protein DinB